MSKTIQTLSRTLILPAIGSFQYLAAVDPGLRDANGNALPCYIDTPDADLSFTINANGTIDIYNVAGKNLAAGKKIVVSSLQKQFNAPVGGELTVTTAPSYPTAQATPPTLSTWATAADSQTFSNTPTIIAFDASSVTPLITTGFLDDPGASSGAFVIRKTGIYMFAFDCTFSATAGGAGTITIQRYINNAALASYAMSRTVNFTGGVTDRQLSTSFIIAVTAAALAATGGAYTIDMRISTSAGTITGKLGGSATTTTLSTTMSVLYLGADAYTAA